MIGGICTILAAIWMFNTSINHKTGNAIRWAIIGAVVFFFVQVLVGWLNVGLHIWDKHDVSMLVIRHRSDGAPQGIMGRFWSIYLELSPPIFGLLAVWAVRAKYLLKGKLQIPSSLSKFTKKK
ncbi:MAG: hypothetical protein V3V31_11780 [Methylococcales bacterium]